jgi:hypothetical protein
MIYDPLSNEVLKAIDLYIGEYRSRSEFIETDRCDPSCGTASPLLAPTRNHSGKQRYGIKRQIENFPVLP